MRYDVWVRADDGHWEIFETGVDASEAIATVAILITKRSFEEVTVRVNKEVDVKQ